MTLKELRVQQKLSQSEFAKRIGVTTATISQIETGRMKVSPKIASNVKEAFGIEPDVGEVVKKVAPKKAAKKAVVKLSERKAAPKKAEKKLEIYIQSPYGGNITPEEIAARMPEGAEACFVRVDQNLIWWIRGEETGAVEIWPSERV